MKSAYNCATVNLHRHGMLSQRRGRRTCGRVDVHVRVAREARTRKSCTPFGLPKSCTPLSLGEKLYTVHRLALAGWTPFKLALKSY